jgi:hypothetical protein
VRSQKDVAGQSFQVAKRPLVVLNNAGVCGVVHQRARVIDADTADDHNIERPAALGGFHCPGCAAFSVTGSEMGHQRVSPQLHLVLVVKDAADQ